MPSAQVVVRYGVEALRAKVLAGMAADKPGPTCDQNASFASHWNSASI
jgi:hypothetical protein